VYRNGATANEDGTIRSLWRYDVGAYHALHATARDLALRLVGRLPIVDTHTASFYAGNRSLEILEMTIATIVVGRWRMDR
jgi:hypothetical protein